MKLNENFHDYQELLYRTANGDQQAFRVIYDTYAGKVYAVAFQILKSAALAEEVMQETMLKLWLVAPNLDRNTFLDGYLRTLTRNRCFNVLRRQVLEAKVALERGSAWTEAHNDTEEHILLEDTSKVLQAGIDLLPPQQKLVYELCQLQGLKYEEAARQLNLSPLTVQSYMKLALRFLRTHVSKHTDIGAMFILFKLIR